MKGDFEMTRVEWLKGLLAQIENLRERIAAAEEDDLVAGEENELQCLERKLETLSGGNGQSRRKSFV
jgi:hypothetical protein